MAKKTPANKTRTTKRAKAAKASSDSKPQGDKDKRAKKASDKESAKKSAPKQARKAVKKSTKKASNKSVAKKSAGKTARAASSKGKTSKKKAAKKAAKKSASKSNKKSARKSAKSASKGKATPKAKKSSKATKKTAPRTGSSKTSPAKAPAKPAEPARKPKAKKVKTPLTKKQLRHFRELLLAKRREIAGDMTSMHEEAFRGGRDSASGDLSIMPDHPANVASDNYEQEFTLGLMESERRLLREIDDALERIERGIYGVCLGTAKPIGLPRLEARPWAKYSIEYTRMVEKGRIREGETLYDEDEIEF